MGTIFLVKCLGKEESLVSTAFRFKLDPRHFSGSGFHLTLSYHARMDDIISCQVSIKSTLKVLGSVSRFSSARNAPTVTKEQKQEIHIFVVAAIFLCGCLLNSGRVCFQTLPFVFDFKLA